jgi:hypothetical protein
LFSMKNVEKHFSCSANSYFTSRQVPLNANHQRNKCEINLMGCKGKINKLTIRGERNRVAEGSSVAKLMKQTIRQPKGRSSLGQRDRYFSRLKLYLQICHEHLIMI